MAFDKFFYRGTPRSCEVKGEPGWFHGFANNDKTLMQTELRIPPEDLRKLRRTVDRELLAPAGCRVEVVRGVCALVEFSDGSVRRVNPEDLRFTDLEEV